MALTLLKLYKAHRIHAGADEHRASKTWMPRAVISWGEPYEYYTVYGSDRYETQDEAILNALDVATKWIDVREFTAKKSA